MAVTIDMDYTALSLPGVRTQLESFARDVQATFGDLDVRQLNWRPGEKQWSVAQCLEHLLAVNRQLLQSMDAALDVRRSRTVWERLPIVPGIMGRMLIRSQAPRGTRKFRAPAKAQPAASHIAVDVLQRVIEQHRDAVARVQELDEDRAAGAIMTSPFVSVITYSVLDAWRLVVAHDHRHFEQARRVTLSPEFPKERAVAGAPLGHAAER